MSLEQYKDANRAELWNILQIQAQVLEEEIRKNAELEKELEKARELFSELYQVLGTHDASELAMDVCSGASDGNFTVGKLLPYFIREIK